jgi:hypothetical protein
MDMLPFSSFVFEVTPGTQIIKNGESVQPLKRKRDADDEGSKSDASDDSDSESEDSDDDTSESDASESSDDDTSESEASDH